jgi:hypothetical protein
MAKKKKQKPIEEGQLPKGRARNLAQEDAIYKELTRYTRRDLQKVCITMGIDFPLVCELSNLQLASWFGKNFENPRNQSLLKEYDDWFEADLIEKGYDPNDSKNIHLFHPAMRMATEVLPEEALKIKPAKEKTKGNTKKRIKDANGVVSGTKKAYTVELAKKGLSDTKIIKKVLAKFPEANEGSIKIWIKRSKQ